MAKCKWEKESEVALGNLQEAQKSFSRSGLYVTSLLLQEVLRVAEYEKATEVLRYKESRKKTVKK